MVRSRTGSRLRRSRTALQRVRLCTLRSGSRDIPNLLIRVRQEGVCFGVGRLGAYCLLQVGNGIFGMMLQREDSSQEKIGAEVVGSLF